MIIKQRLLPSFVLDQLVSSIQDANTLPAIFAKHVSWVHKMCCIESVGNTVLKYLPVDNFGKTKIYNHLCEFGETVGAGAIVSGIVDIVGNAGQTNISHDF